MHAETNAFEHAIAARSGPGQAKPADADQRRRSLEASERAAALGEMARGIAHDFGNVLAVIESGLRLAEASLDRPRDLQAYLAGVHDGIERGRRLTSRLVGFARPAEIGSRSGDANGLIERMLPFLKYAAGPGIRIVPKLADRIPICLIEPSQFSAALLNLVINARDAMPDGGEIEIRTQMHEAANGESHLLVSVTDTGVGMTPETTRRIFEPWFTTKGESGTGLGLPQVRHFVEASGGCIRVSSEPDLGSRFDMLFPAGGNRAASTDLWKQLDRWTNEGGRPEALAMPSRTTARRRSRLNKPGSATAPA